MGSSRRRACAPFAWRSSRRAGRGGITTPAYGPSTWVTACLAAGFGCIESDGLDASVVTAEPACEAGDGGLETAPVDFIGRATVPPSHQLARGESTPNRGPAMLLMLDQVILLMGNDVWRARRAPPVEGSVLGCGSRSDANGACAGRRLRRTASVSLQPSAPTREQTGKGYMHRATLAPPHLSELASSETSLPEPPA